MSKPEDRIDPDDFQRRIELEEKSITGSGARLINQDVSDNFVSPSMSLDEPSDGPDE